jgi:hypothetical protein
MKIDIIITCLERDLPILEIGIKYIKKNISFKNIHIITPKKSIAEFRKRLGDEIIIHDENCMIQGVTIKNLKVIPLAKFSQGPGWYFQQLLKYQFAFHDQSDDYYLIWDADTIPLKPIKFFDEKNRMLFTKASEFHLPYFQTYRKILEEEPHRECSFISQHMIVQKSVMRKMLQKIEDTCEGNENWAWKIMKNLQGEGSNRFSEFETYGHFIKNHYPERIALRELPWLRHGARICGRLPSNRNLKQLSQDYYYASFEGSDRLYRRIGRYIRNKIRGF